MAKRKRTALLTFVAGIALLVLLVYFDATCTQTVSRPELDKVVQRTEGNSFPSQLLYRGSDSDYDYYAVHNFMGSEYNYYRVKRSENQQPARMPVTKSEPAWRNLSAERDDAIRAALLPSTHPATTNPRR